MPAILLFVRKLKDNEIYDRKATSSVRSDDVMLAEDISCVRYVVARLQRVVVHARSPLQCPSRR